MNKNAAELADSLKRQWSGPMTEKEVNFLRDFEGLVEFAIRNGLTFPMVMAAIGNDVNEVFRHGLSIDKALASGFRPQTSGYRELTDDSFGESEE
jgi:hypothetical protein